ncbi:MAG: retroviral-like aspartic protease family protein [Acidobacteria bacterium]|nr:retroviral-like aspartic protease family protein [Acidobacteriota bacterium]
MSKARIYRAKWSGNTLVVAAGVGGAGGEARNIKMLVDTGAGYTILPVELIDALGYDLTQPVGRVRLVTANGLIIAPLVRVSWFNCLGQLVKNFMLAAHTIPAPSFDGVLGMDFLVRHRAVISVAEAQIHCRSSRAGKP